MEYRSYPGDLTYIVSLMDVDRKHVERTLVRRGD